MPSLSASWRHAPPVLLHRTPYGRHQANYREMAEAIAANGYLVVVQDLRGRFDSEGTFLPMWVEGRLDGADGARAVAWAQTLSGALPLVGMYGVSYDASVQWETAALRPAGLRSIFPGGMVADSRSVWPGVFRVGRQLKWYLMLAADTRRRAGLPPPHTRADSDLLWHSRGREVDLEPAPGTTSRPTGWAARALLARVVRSARRGLVRLRADRRTIRMWRSGSSPDGTTAASTRSTCSRPRSRRLAADGRHRADRRPVEPRLRAAAGRRRRRLRPRGRDDLRPRGGRLVRRRTLSYRSRPSRRPAARPRFGCS